MFTSILLDNYLKNKKKNRDRFTTNEDAETEDSLNTIQILSRVVSFVIFVYALYLFFRCYNLKKDFNFLEFLGALCYPFIYIIYRMIYSPEEHCISAEEKMKQVALLAVEISNTVKKIDRDRENENVSEA